MGQSNFFAERNRSISHKQDLRVGRSCRNLPLDGFLSGQVPVAHRLLCPPVTGVWALQPTGAAGVNVAHRGVWRQGHGLVSVLDEM
ncbi:hypothetical protein J6590_036070 [Homalodisca vitripennis]|nr:hypothetical protein J6590_036070 [Homalodisca vitripennis]